MRYLRSNTNGMVFEWNAILARNPNVKEVTEQEAYPERFAPVDLAKRDKVVDLSVPEEIVTPPPEVASELLAEASKPFGRGERLAVKEQSKSNATDVAGLLGEF